MRRKRGSSLAEFGLPDARSRAAPLIYASAATVVARSETATAKPTVFSNFMGGSFAARARLGAIASIPVGSAACARPTQQT